VNLAIHRFRRSAQRRPVVARANNRSINRNAIGWERKIGIDPGISARVIFRVIDEFASVILRMRANPENSRRLSIGLEHGWKQRIQATQPEVEKV
jgi:hypothetical protein